MFLRIIGSSIENLKCPVSDPELSLRNISGFSANVCYSKGYDPDVIEERLSDVDKNIERFNRVSGTLHQSICDHSSVSIYISGISKALAMLLNNLNVYTTSERSSRYTDMSTDEAIPEKERELYKKWKDIFYEEIKLFYPSFDDNRLVKLAGENARYVLSVFNKTTSMIYTTSYRQWSYIIQWIDRFDMQDVFSRRLKEELLEFKDSLLNTGMFMETITEAKMRGFNLIDDVGYFSNTGLVSVEVAGESYEAKYFCSMACLAQLHRHRTIYYSIKLPVVGSESFYIPKFIRGNTDLVNRWCDDLSDVFYPQGTIISVTENSIISNFILKCEERLCGRAQKEITDNVWSVASVLADVYDVEKNKNFFDKLKEGPANVAKCRMLNVCMERCEFGPEHYIGRMV